MEMSRRRVRRRRTRGRKLRNDSAYVHQKLRRRRPGPSSLEDVVDVILDKGMVIDVVARVSLVGVEILFIDARFVIASIDTYLRLADMVDRLALGETAAVGLTD